MVERIAIAAAAACRDIDHERSKLYLDLISLSLKGRVPKALEEIMNSLGYEYQSEFARRYVAEGRAEGKAEGRAEGIAEGNARGLLEGRIQTILRALTRLFGTLDETTQTLVRGARGDRLDRIENRMFDAKSLDEVFE
jgi:predicted transposase YdaD